MQAESYVLFHKYFLKQKYTLSNMHKRQSISPLILVFLYFLLKNIRFMVLTIQTENMRVVVLNIFSNHLHILGRSLNEKISYNNF